MIHSIRGVVRGTLPGAVWLEVGGVGFKVYASTRTSSAALSSGGEVELFCHLHVREDALDLYGFNTPEELKFFELLIGTSGVGPKSALSVLEVASLEDLSAAVQEGRADLLTKASGIGRKIAERIVIELRGRVSAESSAGFVAKMDADQDTIEALVALGYRREEVRQALSRVPPSVGGVSERLKTALQILGKRN